MDESYHFHKLPSSSSSSTSPSTFPATVSSSSSSPPDEISLFLQQFLLRTSSSPSLTGKQPHCSLLSSPPSIFSNTHPSYGGNEISAVDSYLRPNTVNAYSSSVGASENENDEFDCESEEGLMEEIPTKCNNRSSSKRSRAAEVHNLSEKRRRSRINEKMKALQNLIPNSNKTDKASMLDEAIEYLKQLQLQVQMLTMRNGLSLHPMNLPGSLQYLQFSHMRMNFGEENNSLPTDQERSTQIVFSLPDQKTTSNHQLMAGTDKIDAEAPFKLQPSIQAHFAPFHLSESSKDICREDVLRDRRVSMNQLKTTPFEFELGSMAGVSPPYNMAAAELQNSVPVEQCIIEGDHSALTQEGLHQVKQ